MSRWDCSCAATTLLVAIRSPRPVHCRAVVGITGVEMTAKLKEKKEREF